MDIGLVLEGGGGKGAYQIGVWRALRELGIEKHIKVVSGTSVGALNSALFLQGDLARAEKLWFSVSQEQILSNFLSNEDALFTQDGLNHFLRAALANSAYRKKILCYAACKRARDGYIRYFPFHSIIDPGYQRKILLASSAIPAAFPPVELDGEEYVDGGANGDNTPIGPVYENKVSTILVVHLSPEMMTPAWAWPGAEIIDLSPSESLGSFFTGTMDFDPERAKRRYEMGYQDAMTRLWPLAGILRQKEPSPALARTRPSKTPQIPAPLQSEIKQERDDPNMEKIQFENEELQRKYDQRIARLKEIARSPALTTKILWNATASRYAETVGKVQKLMGEEELRSEQVSDRLDKQLNAFLKKCASPEFHIALVGAIKAGKSSLINALLGEELASTKVTPETAALTKFRGTKSDDYVQITFYTPQEWDMLWASAQKALSSKFMEEYQQLQAEKERAEWVGHDVVRTACSSRKQLKDEIKKWTSSRSATHYFVKEVEVGVQAFPLPEGVILVDTPGLNDAVQFRSDITSNYIGRANAVFVCVKADKLSGPELSTIFSVFANTRYNPEKVYIIATQQDALNAPVADWRAQREVWLGYLKDPKCFGSSALAEQNLVSTSAYLYTLLKNQAELDEDRRFQLWSAAMKLRCQPTELPDRYEELLEFTGVSALLRKMNDEIVLKYRDLLVDDIKGSFDLVRSSITNFLEGIQRRQQEIVKASEKSIDDLQKIQSETQKKLEDAKADQEESAELIKQINEQTKSQKKNLMDAIRSLGGSKK